MVTRTDTVKATEVAELTSHENANKKHEWHTPNSFFSLVCRGFISIKWDQNHRIIASLFPLNQTQMRRNVLCMSEWVERYRLWFVSIAHVNDQFTLIIQTSSFRCFAAMRFLCVIEFAGFDGNILNDLYIFVVFLFLVFVFFLEES